MRVEGAGDERKGATEGADRFADEGDVDDLTKEFLAESAEGLDRMERCLTEFEKRPDDAELLHEIFRSVHTIKGTTGFLGFKRLEKLAHAGEQLLDLLRNGKLTANSWVISGLLQLMDGLRAILQLIDKTGHEGQRPTDHDGELIKLIEALELQAAPERRVGVTTGNMAAKTSDASISSGTEKTLRVDVEVLNRMMNLVGELVLTRNQILQSRVNAGNFGELTRRLDSVTADLREVVMQARMQPVGHLFSKFPRMVRDVAMSCGKLVRLEYSGQETGLDKSLLEAIKDPLAHAVRNAIDHGIETASTRENAGKPKEGVVTLRAYHQGGSVVIEVLDDGAGISRSRVIAKALERGVIDEEQASSMPDREALHLIFMPGFSTATEVTEVSGRGVGMDVVRANVERAGGTVEVESTEGAGTLLRFRIPLTLAIVPALIVKSGGQSFCLPQGSLAELVYVPQREIESAVERIGDAELYRLRETLLPMVRLDRLLELPVYEEERGFYIAVLDTDGCKFGLVVDGLMSPEEIVVKPLCGLLREIGLFSGATVLGNGSLAMILDVSATAARAGMKPTPEESTGLEGSPNVGEAQGESYLVFEASRGNFRQERLALPLSSVERIESISWMDVEYAGGRPMLQYRGELLPLDDAGLVLREPNQPDGLVTVLITQRAGGKRVGIVVNKVLDVANGSVAVAEIFPDERIAVVSDRITVLHGSEREWEWRHVA